MFEKIAKITFGSGKKYFVFVFFWVFLSLFSYIFGNNIILGVENYLKEQVKPLLGGDVLLSPLKGAGSFEDLQAYVEKLQWAQTIELSTTLFDDQKNPKFYQAVFHTPNYPFYQAFEFKTIDASGSLIVDQNTYDAFGGEIEVFGKKEKVKWVITKNPLGELSLYASENKIYLPLQDFPKKFNATNARLEYDYYGKFVWPYDEKVIDALKQDPNLKNYLIKSIADRNDTISEITDRFYVFINFFHLIIFILTFFIVILSLESYFKKIKPILGTLNIFGMQKRKIIWYNSVFLGGLFLIGFLCACVGNVVVFSFVSQSYPFLVLFEASLWKGASITVVLFLVGIFSPFYKMYYAQVQELISDSGTLAFFTWKEKMMYVFLMILGFIGIELISGITLYDALFYAFGSGIILLVLYGLISKILVLSYQKFFKKYKDFYIFDAIRSTIKPWNVSFFILFSSILSFLSVFVFFVFSGSFVHFLETLTTQSRDMFLINVQKNDLWLFEKYFSKDEIYEIVTLRISKINGKSLKAFLWTSSVSREFSREFFSTTNVLKTSVLKGRALSTWGVSVDEEFAKRLGLKIWDSIEFWVAGLPISLSIQNLRVSDRNGTNPFFYFQLHPWDFQNYPKTYMISYKQSEKQAGLEYLLNQQVSGSLTVINTKEIVAIVSSIASQILQVVYLCFAYIFLFSFLSFGASISFLQSFKLSKIQILHLLWGNKKRLFGAVAFEYVYLLVFGAILSLLTGSVILWGIFSYNNYFSLYFLSYLLGIALVIGWVLAMSGYVWLTLRLKKS